MQTSVCLAAYNTTVPIQQLYSLRCNDTLRITSPFRIEVEYTTPAPGPWLTVDPTNGTFATDASLALTLTASPQAAPPGAHFARVLLVRTSWPWEVPVEEAVAAVDVQLTVAGPVMVRCCCCVVFETATMCT